MDRRGLGPGLGAWMMGLCAAGVGLLQASDAGASRPLARIVGGVDATETYPFMVALVLNVDGSLRANQFCAGTLIAPDWVLTAAHCTAQLSAGQPALKAEQIAVAIGFTNLETVGSGRVIGVEAIYSNLGFDADRALSDIGLLKLKAPVTGVPFLEVARNDALAAPGASVRAVGWGSVVPNPSAPVRPTTLQEADMMVLSLGQANMAWAGQLVPEMLPVVGGSPTICVGDSGGPLLALIPGSSPRRYRQVGISSFVSNPCGALPSVFTRVSAHTRWLDLHVNRPQMVTTSGDFDGNGTSDLLTQQGRLIRLRDGATFRESTSLFVRPTTEKMGAYGDLDGDGLGELVFRQGPTVLVRSGRNWFNPSRRIGSFTKGFKLRALGDVNGDGSPDLVGQKKLSIEVIASRIVDPFMPGPSNVVTNTVVTVTPVVTTNVVTNMMTNVTIVVTTNFMTNIMTTVTTNGSTNAVEGSDNTRLVADNFQRLDTPVATLETSAKLSGVGDFNGDGVNDLLFVRGRKLVALLGPGFGEEFEVFSSPTGLGRIIGVVRSGQTVQELLSQRGRSVRRLVAPGFLVQPVTSLNNREAGFGPQ